MLIEFHMIQNFAPSCLNRDDTNSPKDCTFGGYRRARISSQCWKRAIRTHELFGTTVAGRVGTRTKRVAEAIAKRLAAAGKAPDEARDAAEAALQLMGFKLDAGATAVLLYVSEAELDRLAAVVGEHLEVLRAGLDPKTLEAKEGKPRQAKLKAKHGIPVEVVKALKELPEATSAADLALFGRMVAENTRMGIDAACQVAHAFSTHRVEPEMDFFTAVDDLSLREDTGSAMMGVVEFNSACFYRYALVQFDVLVQNLGGDRALARDAVLGFAKASVAAIPSGKQNSMAAHNPPSYLRLRVRDGGAPWSLANAFAKPVEAPRSGGDLAWLSIESLREHDQALQAMYSSEGIRLDLESSIFQAVDGVPLAEAWKRLEGALE